MRDLLRTIGSIGSAMLILASPIHGNATSNQPAQPDTTDADVRMVLLIHKSYVVLGRYIQALNEANRDVRFGRPISGELGARLRSLKSDSIGTYDLLAKKLEEDGDSNNAMKNRATAGAIETLPAPNGSADYNDRIKAHFLVARQQKNWSHFAGIHKNLIPR